MKTIPSIIERVLIEFEDSFAYKFDHRPGCSFFNDNASGVACDCGIMDDILSFISSSITSAIEKTEKAYGGCQKCYGKGYAIYRYGETGYDDFGGEGFHTSIKTHIVSCECDRGKQLSQLLEKI